MLIRQLGLKPYEIVYNEMKNFTISRDDDTKDELWILEHYPVYTQGQAGKPEHILNPQDIPIVKSDRGGQVTYHGPGQLVVYVLMNISKRKLGIKALVCHLEQVLIDMLKTYNIAAERIQNAPGVYVGDKKIASIGLRVKNGCTYHGISLNVDLDLGPFRGINPCGYSQLEMTRIKDLSPEATMKDANNKFIESFLKIFNTY
ncbi:MAG: lipoyl(octanoyl) transferase LipB [Legionellaceae bacterium]|nr:lipoyl(octanoyl) transferase LipB [Legionellaceae bacterium]